MYNVGLEIVTSVPANSATKLYFAHQVHMSIVHASIAVLGLPKLTLDEAADVLDTLLYLSDTEIKEKVFGNDVPGVPVVFVELEAN